MIQEKYLFAGGKQDKEELPCVSGIGGDKAMGAAYQLSEAELLEHPLIHELAQTTRFAVITTQNRVEEWRDKLKTTLVFTPKTIKGLEYDVILTIGLYDDPLFKAAVARHPTVLGTIPSNRPKPGCEDAQFITPLNQIYVAYTRAKKILCIVEPPPQHNNKLLSQLLSLLDGPLPNTLPDVDTAETSDWLEQVRLQMLVGNHALAQEIYITKIGEQKTSFHTWKESLLAPLQPIQSAVPSPESVPSATSSPELEPASSATLAPINPPLAPKKQKKNSKSKNSSKKADTQSSPLPSLEQTTPQKKPEQALGSALQVINKSLKSDFKELLKKQPYAEALCAQTNIFFCLAWCSDGHVSLIKWMDTKDFQKNIKNPDFCVALLNALFRFERFEIHGLTINTSALYCLADSKNGSAVLSIIFQKDTVQIQLKNNLELFEFFRKALCTKTDHAAGQNANISALYWLSGSPDGSMILSSILRNGALDLQLQQEKYFRPFFESLCAIRPQIAGIYANTSPLYYLSGNKKARAILSRIVQNEAFERQLQKEEYCTLFLKALCATRTDAAGAAANESALYWLSGIPDGRTVLSSILQYEVLKTQLRQEKYYKLLFEALCATRTEAANEDTNTSALYALSVTLDGCALLSSIFQNEALKIQLQKEGAFTRFLETLCAKLSKAAGAAANESALYKLSRNKEGRAILSGIFENQTFNTQLQQEKYFMHFFEALCAKRPEAAGADANTSALHWLSTAPIGRTILSSILKNQVFSAQLQQVKYFEPFFEALCAKRSEAAGIYINTSTLYWLSETPDSHTVLFGILENQAFSTQLQQEKYFEPFFEALCARLSQAPGIYTNTSALYTLSFNPSGCTILSSILKNQTFNTQLQQEEYFGPFLEALCAIRPEASGTHTNASALYWLSTSTSGRTVLSSILENQTFSTQLQQEKYFGPFFDALCVRVSKAAGQNANTSTLYWLSASTGGRTVLPSILQNEVFKTQLQKEEYFKLFLEALCSKRTAAAGRWSNLSPLYYFSRNQDIHEFFVKTLTNTALINQLLTHEAFWDALFAKTPISSTSYYNYSYLLNAPDYLPQNEQWLSDIFSHSAFGDWIATPSNVQNIIQTLLALSDNMQSVLSKLFSKGASGKKIFEILMRYPAIQQAFFEYFKIPADSLSFWMSQLNSDAAFLLLRALAKFERMSLLQHTSLQTLFESPEIQQLIHMQQIRPEWFLFMAVTQPQYDALLIDFFLNQNRISLYEIDTSGRSLEYLVDDCIMETTEKMSLKEQIRAALQQKTRRYGQTNICTNLYDATTLQADPETITAFVLPAIKPLLHENIHMQKIIQYIDWIVMQPNLSDYHVDFQRLSTNQFILDLQDYTQLLSLLERVCSVMHDAIVQEKPIPFDSNWKNRLGLDITDVVECLHEIHAAFTKLNPFKNYFDTTIKSHIAYFNQLLDTPQNIKENAPKELMRNLLGLPHQLRPPHNPDLLRWSPVIQQWTAQSAMDAFLHSETSLYKYMTQPILDNVSEFLWVKDDLGNQQAVTAIAIKDLIEHPSLRVAHNLWGNSPLCGNTPLSIEDFLKLIFSSDKETQDIISGIASVSDGIIKNINSHAIQEQLTVNMQQAFSTWLHAEPQSPILQYHNNRHNMSALLWAYLIGQNDEHISNLLRQFPHATDAAAIIKYCLHSHLDNISDIQWMRFFEPLSENSTITLFSLLIANPFYTEWFFGFKIKVQEQQQTNPRQVTSIHITWTPTPNAPKFAESLMQNESLKSIRENVLKNALTQPGTLYFWLYYLQQEPLHVNLFQAIIKFVFTYTQGLSQYDSLLPLLLSMQISDIVSAEDKSLVRNFLEQHIDELLQHKHNAYWQTSCYLFDTPENIVKRTHQHIEQYPWLVEQTPHDETVNMARCFLLNEKPIINAQQRTVEIMRQFGLFSTAGTSFSSIEEAAVVENVVIDNPSTDLNG